MVQVLLPEDGDRPLAFYLAMEEYVAWKYPEGDYFFVWRTGPSVIFGRNQDMEAEVNVPYCLAHGIRIYRRKSGGGCVYSDMGNLMHSCITSPGKDAAFVFYRYMQQIALAWEWAKGVTAPIIGATKASHFDDAAGAFSVKLTEEDIAFLEEPYVPHRIVGAVDSNPPEGTKLLDVKK